MFERKDKYGVGDDSDSSSVPRGITTRSGCCPLRSLHVISHGDKILYQLYVEKESLAVLE